MALRDDFEGTGSFVRFVQECNKLFASLNNIRVFMPKGYKGVEPTLKLNGDDRGLTFDMGEALIFTLNNVEWNFSGDADIDDFSVRVEKGKLVINVEANIPPAA